jgi:transcriptional regulator with XRE-family HTH domain
LPGSGSPTVRRRELGVLLRSLRTEHGWTIEQVAERLLVSASKVSRLETGQRGASARDIRDLCDLYGVDAELRQQLQNLAVEGKQHAWWQTSGLPYATYVGLEIEAHSINDFALGVIPGLLQTADYARAVLRAMHPAHPEDVIDQRVGGRLERQQRLRGGEAPRLQALIDEGVLHRVAGSSAIMRDQLRRLLEMSELANVTVQVLPFGAGVLPVTNNKFIILEFAQSGMSEVVFIEGLHGDLYLDRQEDVEMYRSNFLAMRRMAESESGSRMIISSVAASLD